MGLSQGNTFPVLQAGHIVSTGAAPGIAAGTAAGTGPTVALVRATDMTGIIQVTTGTSPASANATVVTITFSSPYGSVPHVILSGHNNAAKALAVATQTFGANESTTSFDVVGGNTALQAATAYEWTYMVIQ